MTFSLRSNFAAISAVQLIWTMLASGVHVASLAQGIRLVRANAKAGDVFNGAAEQFRQIILEDAKDRSVRATFAAMPEVP